MAVYTDGLHLVSESIDELHAFASLLGLKREWFQGAHNGHQRHPHYDIMALYRVRLAYRLGAVPTTKREAAAISRKASIAGLVAEEDPIR